MAGAAEASGLGETGTALDGAGAGSDPAAARARAGSGAPAGVGARCPLAPWQQSIPIVPIARHIARPPAFIGHAEDEQIGAWRRSRRAAARAKTGIARSARRLAIFEDYTRGHLRSAASAGGAFFLTVGERWRMKNVVAPPAPRASVPILRGEPMMSPDRIFLLLGMAMLLGVGVPSSASEPASSQPSSDEEQHMQRMAAEHAGDRPLASPAATTPPAQPVTGEAVVYGQAGGKPIHGFLARPKGAKGPLPGIVVIHEWWGLNDNVRDMARRLAGEGYAALAVDLYGGVTAATPDQAMQLMQATGKDPAAAKANLRQAYDYLSTREHAPRIGVIGWCFGGGWSLNTALMLPDKIAATVIYYGHLTTDRAELAKLQMPVIGFFGGEDKSIPVASVHEFESTLKSLGKPVEVHVYEGAGHAFANPSGTGYRPQAASDAWTRTVAFLAKSLKPGAAA
jgi:carboxymethylenebutenolidase